MQIRLFILACVLLSVLPARLTLPHPVDIRASASAWADEDDSVSASRPTRQKEKDPPLSTRLQAAADALLAKLGINAEFAKYYATWVVGAPTLVIVILLAMMLRPRRNKITPARLQRAEAVVRKKPARAMPYKARLEPEPTTDKERILRSFFHLFKEQMGADPDAPTDLKLVVLKSEK